jgi:hypothetical protein
MNMQVRFLPIALWMMAAATVESTPPETPAITFLLPTCLRIFATSTSMKLPMFQSSLQLADSKREIFYAEALCLPACGLLLRGTACHRICGSHHRLWHTAQNRFSRSGRSPLGSLVTLSPWLIHTWCFVPFFQTFLVIARCFF